MKQLIFMIRKIKYFSKVSFINDVALGGFRKVGFNIRYSFVVIRVIQGGRW